MAYDPGALEATLAAVVGEHSSLIAELREAFFISANAHLEAMQGAAEPKQWLEAVGKLRSLAASFGLQRVMDAAAAAAAAPCGDKRTIARIERALGALRPTALD